MTIDQVANAGSAIEIVAEPPPWMLFARWLMKVSIDIDGQLARLRWGTHAFAVAPGEHVVTVGAGSAFGSKAIARVVVNAGETLRLRYVPRLIKHLRGQLIVERLPTARTITR